MQVFLNQFVLLNDFANEQTEPPVLCFTSQLYIGCYFPDTGLPYLDYGSVQPPFFLDLIKQVNL